MQIDLKSLKYEWQADWAKLPAMSGWSHHGLVVNRDGNIVTGHATEAKILILSPEGELLREFPVPVTETHGLCLMEENGEEFLWIADVGNKYETKSFGPARVVKVDMQGKELAQLTAKDFGYGTKEGFCPTTMTVDPGNGKLWVTDGYGSSRVHCFSRELEREFTISGSHEIGMFNCPHWIYADTRKGETEIYVADRGNNRVQIFSSEGKFLRGITEGLSAPSVFSTFEDYLVIGELNARLVILDKNDAIVGAIGDGVKQNMSKEGWPNRKQGDKVVSPLSDIPKGLFNSPHGMAADKAGNIYVSEWLIGDRFTKLKRVG